MVCANISVMWWAVFLAAPVVLSGTFPADVPSGRAIESWERVAGRGDYKGTHVAYELFVDPRRLALFTLTRYRIHFVGKEHAEDEILIWNAQPGMRPVVPVRCFVRVARRRPGLADAFGWDVVPPETGPYKQAMYKAIEVYALESGQRRQANAGAK